MSDVVQWMLEMDINPGHEDAVEGLMEEMVAATRSKEDGALIYEWFISRNGRSVHIYERYADSDAVITHMANFAASFAARFLTVFQPTRLYIYGNASEDVIATMAGLAPVHLAPLGGFAR